MKGLIGRQEEPLVTALTLPGRERDGSPFRFAGVALSSWAFALRTWIATMTALYVAFWLQLQNAYSAAVCVSILALPTRGQAFEKALYRTGGTVIGLLASLVIAGLFGGARDLFILAFAAWMAVCGYVASVLDGNRAYGAVLSGFTTAIIAFANIDTPQNVFSTGMDRCAAILVGVLAVMVVNDLLGAPDAFPGLSSKLEATHRRIVAFAKKVLSDRNVDPIEVNDLLKALVGLRTDIAVLLTESIAGRNRAAAARTALAAMAQQMAAARIVGKIMTEQGSAASYLVDTFSQDLENPEEDANTLKRIGDAQIGLSPLLVAASAAQVFMSQSRRALASLDMMRTGRSSPPAPSLPRLLTREAAFRNALRLFLAMLIGSTLLILSGWPSVSNVMVMFAAVAAISVTAASPQEFARNALIAMFSAVALIGITEFLILDGTDSLPMLALGWAPTIIGSCLLATSGNPRLAPVGTLILVFMPLIFLPSNPPNYDPQFYLTEATFNIVSVVLLFVTVGVLLPTSDDRKRAWILRSLHRDFRRALTEARLSCDPDEVAFRDADRECQLEALRPATSSGEQFDARASHLSELTSAAWRVRFALELLHRDMYEEGRLALAAVDPIRLSALAYRLLKQRDGVAGTFERQGRAAAALTWMAILIERSPCETAALNEGSGW
jgi:uncharacterized membrane protein YccC